MIDLPDEIIYKIYVYGGANIFYLNKNGLKYIQKLRLEFLKKPIKIFYNIVQYEKRILFNNNIFNPTNIRVNIIKTNIDEVRTFQLWRGKIGYYTFNNNIVSFNLYNSFKEKIIDKTKLVDKDYFKNNDDISDVTIQLNKRYDVNDIWCYDNRLFKYIELWS